MTPSITLDSGCNSDADSVSDFTKVVKKRARPTERAPRVSSSYTPRYRLSRYQETLKSLIPKREARTDIIPVDTVGILSNLSFAWVPRLLKSKSCDDELPKCPPAERCTVNGRRFWGIYKEKETLNGRKNVSMLGVVWRFSRTRLLFASLFHLTSLLLPVLAVMPFFNQILESKMPAACSATTQLADSTAAPQTILGIRFEKSNSTRVACLASTTAFSLNTAQILALVGVWLCLLLPTVCNGCFDWINLRTAVRIRAAVLATVYKRAMKSNTQLCIAPHQIMTLAMEESDFLFRFCEAAAKTISTVLAYIALLIVCCVLRGIAGIFLLVGITLLLVPLVLLGTIARRYQQRYLGHGALKATIVDELCSNFKNIVALRLGSAFMYRYLRALANQYLANRWARFFAAKFSGGMTSVILLGGLYLIWCDTNIASESNEVLTLLFLFFVIAQQFMTELCQCVHLLQHGILTWRKVKATFQLPALDYIRQRPKTTDVAIQIANAEFAWFQVDVPFRLCVDRFDIPIGYVIGITGSSGSGKTMLLQSILRNTETKKGSFLQKGMATYYPSKPFLLASTVRENVVFGESFDAQRYYLATTAMRLNEDLLSVVGAEDIPVSYLELTAVQTERIALARAIYSSSEIVLLDEPLSSMRSRDRARSFFLRLFASLEQEKKTVIVVSNRDDILQHCQQLYLVENGVVHMEKAHTVDGQRKRRETLSAVVEECYEGSSVCGIHTEPSASRSRGSSMSQRAGENSDQQPPLETDDQKAQKSLMKGWRVQLFGVCSHLLLIMLHFLRHVFYFGLLVMLVVVVEQEDINPWMSSTSFLVFILTLGCELSCKYYRALVMTTRTVSYQQRLFATLLNCNLSHLLSTPITDIASLFSDVSSRGYEHQDALIHHALAILFSSGTLLIACYWSFPIILFLLVTSTVLFYYTRASFRRFSHFEQLSTKRMYVLLTNHLYGRAVIHSFDAVSNLSTDYFTAVEDTNSAIYLQFATVAFVEFWINFCGNVVALPSLLLLLVLNSPLSMYRAALGLISYVILLSNWKGLIRSALRIGSARQCIQRQYDESLAIQVVALSPQASVTLSAPLDFCGDVGFAVSIQGLCYRLVGRKLLDIPVLDIKAGESVAICGTGSSLLVPLLCRIATPTRGQIFFNTLDISKIHPDELRGYIGVVTANRCVYDLTIAEFLNSDELVADDAIQQALAVVQLQETVDQLPQQLHDYVSRLSQEQQQLLCLAKCYLNPPKLLIVELANVQISPNIAALLDMKFQMTTRIVICSHDTPWEAYCDRLIDLDLAVHKN